MVPSRATADSAGVTPQPTVPLPRASAEVVDLHVRRMGGQDAVTRAAAAPVRHLPAALLDALQGSWGTPEELGLRAPRVRLVAG